VVDSDLRPSGLPLPNASVFFSLHLDLAYFAYLQSFCSLSLSLAITINIRIQKFAADGSNIILLCPPSNRPAVQYLADSINAQKVGIVVLAEVDLSALCRASGERTPKDMAADSSEGDRVNTALDDSLQMFGRIDILVHADDGITKGALDEIDEELFDVMIRTNVKEPLFLTKFVARHMTQGGRILFFSSFVTQATTILPKALLYAGCKGAIEQITRVLAKDLGERGITVNTIAPGPLDTPLFRLGKSSDELQRIAELSPSRRLAFVDEILPVVVFLTTRDAGWINGQIIPVNGVRINLIKTCKHQLISCSQGYVV